MIDRIKFDQNFQYFDIEITIEIIEIYISEDQERFSRIRNIIAQKDFENLYFYACSLKGLVLNFFDPVVIEQSYQLNIMARSKIEDGLEKLFKELEISNGLMIEELKAIKVELLSVKHR